MKKDISNQILNQVIRNKEETPSSSWKCYRCGLIFYEEWLMSLHKEISNHPYRKVESSRSRFMLALRSKLKEGPK
jgi:hypothetical protein